MDTGAVPVYFMLNGMRFGVRSGSDPFSGTMSWIDMMIGVREGFEIRRVASTVSAKAAEDPLAQTAWIYSVIRKRIHAPYVIIRLRFPQLSNETGVAQLRAVNQGMKPVKSQAVIT